MLFKILVLDQITLKQGCGGPRVRHFLGDPWVTQGQSREAGGAERQEE